MTRVLVAYASKNGSTAEIAEAIAQGLERHGLEVDCLEAGAVRHLESYGAVVLGSAVYAKRWRGSARQFLRRHRAVLPSVPWWVFSSGPVGEPKPDSPDAAAWLEPPKSWSRSSTWVHVSMSCSEVACRLTRTTSSSARWPRTRRPSSPTAATGTRSRHGRPRSQRSSSWAAESRPPPERSLGLALPWSAREPRHR